jgi:hypothetical protein
MHLEPFKAEDFFRIEGREGRATEEHEWLVNIYQGRSYYQRPDGTIGRSAYTFWENGWPIGALGVVLAFGVGQAWLHGSDQLFIHPLSFHKAAKNFIETVKKEAGLRRIESAIAAKNHRNRKWFKSLGFSYDGPAFNYGPNGEMFMRYAWINTPKHDEKSSSFGTERRTA